MQEVLKFFRFDFWTIDIFILMAVNSGKQRFKNAESISRL